MGDSADFHIKQGDTNPPIKSQLLDENGNAVDISGYNEVGFHMKKPGSTTVKVDADTTSGVSVTDAANGKVEYQWSTGDTDTMGRFHAEWEVEFSDGNIETFPNTGYLEIRIPSELA